MAFFNQSTKTTAVAVAEIADSAGASGDSEMTARAGRSLDAAFHHFNNFANWDFCMAEAPTVLVTAPFHLTGASCTAGGYHLCTPTTAHGILPHDFIEGDMFSEPNRVTATAASAAPWGAIYFANPFSSALVSAAGQTFASCTANRDMYDAPTDLKAVYSVRMLGAERTLRQLGRRHYDRSTTDEFINDSSPLWYDMSRLSETGKLRLLPAPSETDRLLIRYYRRMQSSSATCDIPSDYDMYLIAWAKWHILTDKAESQDRANAWLSLAMDGLKRMIADMTRKPDEDLGFVPGHYSYNVSLGPNSVRNDDGW